MLITRPRQKNYCALSWWDYQIRGGPSNIWKLDYGVQATDSPKQHIFCPSFILLLWQNTLTKGSLVRKGLLGLHFQVTGYKWGKPRQEPGGSNWSRGHRGTLLSGSFSGFFSGSRFSRFVMQLRTICLETVLPVLGWVLLHRLIIMMHHHRRLHRPVWSGPLLHDGFLFRWF